MCASYLPAPAPAVVSTHPHHQTQEEGGREDTKPTSDPLYVALLGKRVEATSASFNEGEPPSTLDEPISETLKRDVRMVYDKTWMILGMKDPQVSLRDWDLWGPLANSLLIAISLASSVANFTASFTFMWLGAVLLTLNARLLGYRLSLLPCSAFVGYCLGPTAVAGIVTATLLRIFVLRVVLVGAAASWGALAALVALETDPALEDRRLLAAFPIVLYFVLLAWFFVTS